MEPVCGWSNIETETAAADGAVIWNKLPDYIFVRFETRTRWTIPGIDQENVFPVSIQSAQWFLDAGRTNPQLKVTRYQFPIAPDFADTFYGAQGSTIEPGVIVDMVDADPIAAYIGMTRCRTRQKILIYRPFPLAPFQAGLPLGRQLLLDVWKQEPVDWDALRKKYLDERQCHECGDMKRKDAFTKAQWKQETYRVCKECTTQKREAGTPYRCTQCGLWHAICHFASKHFFANSSKRKNISALRHGRYGTLTGDSVYDAKPKSVDIGRAQSARKASQSSSSQFFSRRHLPVNMANRSATPVMWPQSKLPSASVPLC